MAKFNPEVQAEGQNYLGYSRGQEVDDSLGILFKGAANVAEGAGTVADNYIQGRIREDITREYDATNDSFGVDAASVVRGNTTGPGSSLPPEIEQSKNWFGKVSNAFLSGDLRESHYSARLEQRVKDLRTRYPGYREQIDSIVADVTGMTPANVLRQQLFSEWESERKSMLDDASDEEKLINGWLDGGELDPNLGSRWVAGDRSPELVAAIKNDVLNTSYTRAEVTSETGRLSLRKAQKEDIRDDADTTLARVTSEIGNKVMETGYNQFGFNRDDFINSITAAGEDFIVSEEEMGPLLQQLNMGEAAALAAYDEAIYKPWDKDNNNFSNSANPDAIKRGREELTARFAHLREMLTNKDTGLLKLDAAMLEARKNKNVRELIEKFPIFEKAQTIREVGGQEIFNYLLTKKMGPALAVATHGYITGKLMTGDTGSLDEAFTEMKELGIKDPKAYGDILDAEITKLIDDRSSVEVKEMAFNNIFGEDNNDFLLQIDENQRLIAFNKLTNPEQTKVIAELAESNPKIMDDYRRWSKDNFQVLFSNRIDEIHQTFQDAEGQAEIVLDPDTGQFEVIYGQPDQTGTEMYTDPLTGEQTPMPGQDILDRSSQSGALEAKLKGNLNPLNQYLRNMKAISDAAGTDFPQDVAEIFSGVDIMIELEEGEDTSEPISADDADLSSRDIMIDGLDDIADVDLETPEEQQAIFGEADDDDLAGYGGEDALEASAQVLREFEGFRERPYWDVTAHRVGYGSDTITKEDGSVVRVKKGMSVSREDAERDLKRRIGEFQNVARKQTGKTSWDGLSSNVQAALTSVTYNYGRLPKVVVNAVKTGEPKKIASAILKLKNHNGGVNAGRRTKEARIVLAGM